MPSISQGPQSQLWQTLIAESAARRRVQLDETEESYLGFVLIRHMRDPSLAGRVMALDWLHAGSASGAQRADAMRDVGDRCLLIAGLYPQLARRRRVTPDYYAAIGCDAYRAASQAARAGYGLLFAQLADAFARLVEVLRALRGEAHAAQPSGRQRQPALMAADGRAERRH